MNNVIQIWWRQIEGVCQEVWLCWGPRRVHGTMRVCWAGLSLPGGSHDNHMITNICKINMNWQVIIVHIPYVMFCPWGLGGVSVEPSVGNLPLPRPKAAKAPQLASWRNLHSWRNMSIIAQYHCMLSNIASKSLMSIHIMNSRCCTE